VCCRVLSCVGQDILTDVRDETEKHGTVVSVTIPRPPSDSKGPAPTPADPSKPDGDDGRRGVGVGRIFVLYTDSAATAKAVAALNGRQFNSNRVEASFFSETDFAERRFDA
jgi:splicing factor U2AF 65 kDa subunit